MTRRASRATVEEVHAAPGFRRQCGIVARQVTIERAVVVAPLRPDEGGECIRDFDDGHLLRLLDVIEGGDEHLAIFRDDPHALGEDRPCIVDPVVDRAGDFVFLRIAGHLEPGGQWEDGLRSEDRFQTLWQPFLRRRVEAVAVEVGGLQAAVVEHHADVLRAEVPECGGVPGDTLADAVFCAFADPLRPQAFTALADTKAQPVGATKVVVVAGTAGDVPVAAEDLVVKQKLAEFGLLRIELNEIVIRQRARQRDLVGWQFGRARGQRKAQGKDMKQTIHAVILAGCMCLATPVWAEIEEARDLMEAGQFEAAREALLPAARSGNADAEELIGVMYALGLGVERDPERAFEWYLRSSMKGHPGAQSGVGWYYEVGLGMPAPDLVRAYMWYALSAIGGDPDAAISLEEVVKKMTPEEIARAQVLIDDYKPWMYPFR